MGTILTWIGFIMVLYSEIKAVLIVSPPCIACMGSDPVSRASCRLFVRRSD
jgi:hypothetical protein